MARAPAGILFQEESRPVRIWLEEPQASQRLAQAFCAAVRRYPADRSQRLGFLCIGTDRATGDALGPLVGTFLQEWGFPDDRIAGTLASPVHATNLHRFVEAPAGGPSPGGSPPLVVAIDACLGREETVGSVAVGEGPLRPGAGVRKELPPVGDLYVTGTVNVGGFMEYLVLQNTRLHLVIRMARMISEGLFRGARMAGVC